MLRWLLFLSFKSHRYIILLIGAAVQVVEASVTKPMPRRISLSEDGFISVTIEYRISKRCSFLGIFAYIAGSMILRV